jgi:hypothetical protein
MGARDKESEIQDRLSSHINALADRLGEAYEVVARLRKIGREKQKAHYDKNTKLVTFSEGEYVYLKEIIIGVGKSKKFRNRWRVPYLITKRFSDLNYKIQTKPGNCVRVNVNRMKRYYNPPGRKRARKGTVPTTETKQSYDDWSETEDEPLYLLERPKIIPSSRDKSPNFENKGTTDVTVTDDKVRDDTDASDKPIREGQDTEDRSLDNADFPSYYLRNRCRSQSDATPPAETQEVADRQTNSVNEEGNVIDEGQPYPYFLITLPGRRN